MNPDKNTSWKVGTMAKDISLTMGYKGAKFLWFFALPGFGIQLAAQAVTGQLWGNPDKVSPTAKSFTKLVDLCMKPFLLPSKPLYWMEEKYPELATRAIRKLPPPKL